MSDWAERQRKIDFALIAIAAGLAVLSLLVLNSIGAGSGEGAQFAKKQGVWLVAGLAVMVAVGFFNYTRLRHYLPFIYGLNLAMLIVIYMVGSTALGAQRWIEIGPFRFQPSEFSKLMVIVTLASYLAERKGEIAGWRDILLAIGHVVPFIVLILLQPDLGTALVLVAVLAGMLVVGGVTPKQMLVLMFLAYLAIGLVFKFNLLHDYQMKRLVVFVNPEVDPLGSGYNLRQSIIAIGSGGLAGKGLFSGTQSRLNFLPPAVRHTDFIFAVLGEELGFAGGLALIAGFFLLLTRSLRAASLSRNYYGLLIGTGIVSMWAFQLLVNIGMTIGIMPVTGIPLPFISYGGSSLIMNMAAVGLLLSIFSRRWR